MLSAAIAEAIDELAANRGPPRRLLLAVSGGPDSLALLLTAAMARAANPQWPETFVATVDHGLRPEAVAEARFVAALCAELGLGHQTLRWDGGSRAGGNLQAEARDARYRLLAAEARRVGASAILAAHHRDDQIETHLLARRRGGRGPTLAGMRSWRDLDPGLVLLRPFLSASKAELRGIVADAGIRPIEDPSNDDLRFARAALRAELAQGLCDTAALLRDIETASRERQAFDAAIAERIISLLEGGKLAADQDGTVRLCEQAGGGTDRFVLARVLTAVGGGLYPPEPAKIERLSTRLNESSQAVLTLGGCRIEKRGHDLHVMREFGRDGPPGLPVSRDDRRVVFDNRFDIGVLQEQWHQARIEPFGRLGRGSAPARSLPICLDAEGGVIAAHSALVGALPGVPALEACSRIGWRIWANLPCPAPVRLTHGLQIAANATEPVGKDLAATYLR